MCGRPGQCPPVLGQTAADLCCVFEAGQVSEFRPGYSRWLVAAQVLADLRKPPGGAAGSVVPSVSEAAEHRGGPGGAGDHVTQGDRGQGGGVTEHLHTPGVGHVTGHAASDGVCVRGWRHLGAPGHMGHHLHPDTGQTGLAQLKITQES